MYNFKLGSTSEAGQGWPLLTSSWLVTGSDITVDFGTGSGIQKAKTKAPSSNSLELKMTTSNSCLWSEGLERTDLS